MIPGSTPFSTDTIARAKRLREIIRIFVLTVLMCTVMAKGSGASFPEAARFAILDGSMFAAMIIFVRHVVPLVKFRSVGFAFIFRSLAYFLVFLTSVCLVILTVKNGESLVAFFEKHPAVIGWALFFFYLQVLVITGIRGVSKKFGPGAFRNWIRGYYYTPKEEERIFMFLDMRRSTELAEKLGDLKFSKLVRDFFDDLTAPIVETRAEVSHYIGDEAVLTWWPKHGLPDARCLQCVFRMKAALDKRRDYYMKEYGLVPEFKASAHIGRVVATEVGQIKSEIVFHGDVLNTTSRVQNACSEFGVDFLITEALAQRLPQTPWVDLKPIGAVALKGKSEKVQLLSAKVKTK